ncbi:ribosome-associated protein [Georgenia satyanarayanai]|uniref:Ribosome-associated protein n=2 Tax=Georgenia satyanarayanai TaxID=860221 RepID=A0A2Y9BY07_9MICO|nr:ribosome-associated protein [Georgenia satyanarayanai]SSA41792.1 ribosome-associated protein [Georgenia satyanarayanai]
MIGAMEAQNVVPVDGEIRLGQFLKLASLAESGAQARELIADGEVSVDGVVETRRGRQLATGARVEVSTPGGVLVAVVG